MKKKDNRGFSLIELLVAITILAVIVVPLLHSFYTAANTNTKAKRVLNATTAGQNWMEKLKTESLEQNMGDATQEQAVDASRNPITDTDGNPVYLLKKEFSDTVNGQIYKVDVTLDPSAYMGKTDADGNQILKGTDYNSQKFAQISNMNSALNAFFVMEPGDDIKAAKKIDEADYENVLQTMTRKITVEIEAKPAADPNDQSKDIAVYASVYYNGDLQKARQSIYDNYQNVDSAKEKNVLENVFIFFNPLYNNDSVLAPREEIEVKNPDNLPVKVYLVRQEKDAELLQKNRYSVQVDVDEGTTGTPVVTKLVTNLTASESDADSQLQLRYLQNGVLIKSGKDARQQLGVETGNLTDAKSITKIYDVEIKVYKNDDTSKTEPLATLTGTKTE